MKGTCRLCLQDSVLRKSHIIPEFFYKNTYDEEHRLPEISLNPAVPNRWRRRKGVYERMLCGK